MSSDTILLIAFNLMAQDRLAGDDGNDTVGRAGPFFASGLFFLRHPTVLIHAGGELAAIIRVLLAVL